MTRHTSFFQAILLLLVSCVLSLRDVSLPPTVSHAEYDLHSNLQMETDSQRLLAEGDPKPLPL